MVEKSQIMSKMVDSNSSRESRRESSARGPWSFVPTPFTSVAPYWRSASWGERITHFFASWSPRTDRVLIFFTALVSWMFFTPALDRCKDFSADWMFEVWLDEF